MVLAGCAVFDLVTWPLGKGYNVRRFFIVQVWSRQGFNGYMRDKAEQDMGIWLISLDSYLFQKKLLLNVKYVHIHLYMKDKILVSSYN